MSRTTTAFVAAAMLAVGGSLIAQSGVPQLTVTATDLLKTPNDVFVGEVAGVGANSKGQIFVYTRTGHPYATLGDNRTFSHGGSKLFVFDNNGKGRWKRSHVPGAKNLNAYSFDQHDLPDDLEVTLVFYCSGPG